MLSLCSLTHTPHHTTHTHTTQVRLWLELDCDIWPGLSRILGQLPGLAEVVVRARAPHPLAAPDLAALLGAATRLQVGARGRVVGAWVDWVWVWVGWVDWVWVWVGVGVGGCGCGWVWVVG